MKQKIKSLVKRYEKDIVTFTREMVSIPSFSGEEKTVIARIKDEMENLAFDDVYIDRMGNLIGKIGSGSKSIAIDGHADTVEVGNRDNWKYDPFEAKIVDNNIYGRGTADQKGGVASLIYAGQILNKIGVSSDYTIYFIISVQEEVYEGLNWQYIIKKDGIVPDIVILTEPSYLQIANGHRGRADLKVKTKGISSHGAAPEKGDNAIYKIAPIIIDIEKLNTSLPIDPIFGKSCISVTTIDSTSPSQNAIPDSAIIHVDRRLTQQDKRENVIDELKALKSVKNVNAEVFIPKYEYKSNSNDIFSFEAFYPSWYVDKSHPLIQTAISSFESQFSSNPEVKTWAFSTNGAATKGIYDIPTFGFGPGDETLAHTSNEHVPIEHLFRATEFYSAFVMNWTNQF
jgi:putative selenium metabolism hydrolase